MKIHFITYSDINYQEQQIKLDKIANKFFILNSYNRDWLITTDFYLKNKSILDLHRGGGYWLWKPFIILETLNKMEYGDVLFYLDCGDIFTDGLYYFLNNYFDNSELDSLLTYGGQNKQKWYTKRDTFLLMGCDEEKYHEFPQLEAGFFIVKKTQENIKLINETIIKKLII